MKRIRAKLGEIIPGVTFFSGPIISAVTVTLLPSLFKWYGTLGLFIVWVAVIVWVTYGCSRNSIAVKIIKSFKLILLIWLSFLVFTVFLFGILYWVDRGSLSGFLCLCVFGTIFMIAPWIAMGATAFLHDLLNEKNKPVCESGTAIK